MSSFDTNYWPSFNFRALPLSVESRAQLAGIYDAVCASNKVPKSRLGLLTHFIGKHAFDPHQGTYFPLSDTVFLPGKLPQYSRQWLAAENGLPPLPLSTPYFGNSLLIPAGYGAKDFRDEEAPKPRDRATNVGLVAVTMEVDCSSVDEFEETLSWTRGEEPQISKLHSELCQFKDYRGYSAVFTGNKSIHFHFIFSTTHLKNAPYDLSAEDRAFDSERASALLHNSHRTLFDQVGDLFASVLNPPLPPDSKMRSFTQWRRTPWAIREISESDKSLFGLPVGTKVPQMVLCERILIRASKGADQYYISPNFSLSHPVSSSKERRTEISQGVFSVSLALAQEYCHSEWGPWPKPAGVCNDGGEWVFNFYNHEDDRKPSTYVRGEYRTLSLVGSHSHVRRFFLPDGMSAQELGEHLAARAV